MPTFADRLKQLRTQAGLTQAALAQATGLSLGIIRDYEQRLKEPSLRSAFKLAKALGVDCTAFRDCIDGEEEPAPKQTRPKGRKRKGE
jgi:transcriptional regulator with XRE-family HTH domain